MKAISDDKQPPELVNQTNLLKFTSAMKQQLKRLYHGLARKAEGIKQQLNTLPLQVRCLLCKGHTVYASPLCTHCQVCLPVPDSLCACCGLPMPESLSEFCAQCLQKKPPFDHCLVAFIYDYPVNFIIQKIKYSNRLEFIPLMVTPLIDVLEDHYTGKPWPEVITPVPLHPKKLRTRGFNQSDLLAKAILKQLPAYTNCELNSALIQKKRNTLPQQSLPAKVRRKNIRSAFTINNKCRYQHVAIIDDVVTTAETVREITRVLKKSGVQQVDVWCLARTPQIRCSSSDLI